MKSNKQNMHDTFVDTILQGSYSDAILDSESRGQKEMIQSVVLPINSDVQQELEKLGVVYNDDDDDLFVNVTLPEGWRVEASDHSMHSSLINQDSKRIANIFYKAAFYDRRADIWLIK